MTESNQQAHHFTGKEVMENLKVLPGYEIERFIAEEKAHPKPRAGLIKQAEARLDKLKAEAEKAEAEIDDLLADLDVDALYEKWSTPSTDGGWSDDEHALYAKLDVEVQGALKRAFERRAEKA
jgi:hypothetical protein